MHIYIYILFIYLNKHAYIYIEHSTPNHAGCILFASFLLIYIIYRHETPTGVPAKDAVGEDALLTLLELRASPNLAETSGSSALGFCSTIKVGWGKTMTLIYLGKLWLIREIIPKWP